MPLSIDDLANSYLGGGSKPGFFLQQYRYKLRTGRDYLRDWKSAIDGNNEALFLLVSFDVTFLGEKWAIARLKEEQDSGNKDFFQKLAKSVRSPKRWGTKHKHLVFAELLAEFLRNHPKYLQPRGKKRLCDELYQAAEERLPEDHPIFKLTQDFEHFLIFLKRYGLDKQ